MDGCVMCGAWTRTGGGVCDECRPVYLPETESAAFRFGARMRAAVDSFGEIGEIAFMFAAGAGLLFAVMSL